MVEETRRQVDAVVGHSMGEAAPRICGAISFEDALRIVCRRSALMRRKDGQGAMAWSIFRATEVAAAFVGQEARVSIAATNSPRACIISGDTEAVGHAGRAVHVSRRVQPLVKVDVASHCPHMEGPRASLAECSPGLSPAATRNSFVSSLLATWPHRA